MSSFHCTVRWYILVYTVMCWNQVARREVSLFFISPDHKGAGPAAEGGVKVGYDFIGISDNEEKATSSSNKMVFLQSKI